jgi:hypothetical protein
MNHKLDLWGARACATFAVLDDLPLPCNALKSLDRQLPLFLCSEVQMPACLSPRCRLLVAPKPVFDQGKQKTRIVTDVSF